MNYIRMHRRTIGIAAGVLAIAAIAVPVASARPNLEPLPTVHVSATTAHATVVKPNPDQQAPQTAQTATGVPPGLSRSQASEIAALDRAKARSLANHPSPTGPYSTAALTTAATPVASPTLTAPGSGFDWGDAAVGAGVAAAIGLLIAAASVAVRHRTEPRHP
jgi:hypothetical protein